MSRSLRPATMLVAALPLVTLFRPQALDRADAAAVARAVLSAYQARDLARMSALANATNRPLFAELAARGERHERYASMFRGWRWEAVRQWDPSGAIADVRYTGPDEALVLFGQLGPNEVVVVVLTWEAGGWAFEDINSPSRARFEALARRRPERRRRRAGARRTPALS